MSGAGSIAGVANMRIDGRIAVSGTMVAVFAAALMAALTYGPDGRLAPLVVVVPGLVLSAIQLSLDLFGSGERDRTEFDPARRRRAFILIGYLAAFVLGTVLVGLPLTALILVFTYLKVYQREGALISGAISLVLALSAFLFLETVFGIGLVGGLVGSGNLF
jgi:hypothetical protein